MNYVEAIYLKSDPAEFERVKDDFILDEEKMKELKGKTVVLWVSRHPPVPKQIKILSEKIKNLHIVFVGTKLDERAVQSIISYIGSFTLINIPKIENDLQVISIARSYNAKYIIPVLPLLFIKRLLEHKEFIILYALTEELHEEESNEPCKEFDQETDFIYRRKHYRFREFKILKEVKLIFEDF